MLVTVLGSLQPVRVCNNLDALMSPREHITVKDNIRFIASVSVTDTIIKWLDVKNMRYLLGGESHLHTLLWGMFLYKRRKFFCCIIVGYLNTQSYRE
jgi:hypothetical protein